MGGSTSCPVGSKLCPDNDYNCIEPGESGSIDGWCKDSSSCYDTGYTEQYCVAWNDWGDTQCPSTHPKKCSKWDTNCIESGESGPIDGWCMNAMSCYSETEQYCEPWGNHPTPMASMSAYMEPHEEPECPTTHPKQCRPGDTNCIEIGDTGPANGWCASGGQQCFMPDGDLYCVEWGSTCPSDAGACRPGEDYCVEPGEYSTYDSSTYSYSYWCGGNSAQCYSDDQMYCSPVSGNDPQAWEKAECPESFSRCRPGEDYCLELGETGTSGSWCAAGMMQWNDDGSVTCVSGDNWNNDGDDDEDVCLQVITPAYSAVKDKCKNFSDSCIPSGWSVLPTSQICKDGNIVD